MRTLFRLSGALVLAAVAGYFFAPGVMTHLVKTPGVMAQGSGRMAIYNTATETSVSGTLAQPPARGRMGVYLSVEQASGEMVDVRLAPRKYLASQGFSVEQGDALEITGSRVTMHGSPVLIAREITRQGRRVELRDSAGRPLWR